MGDFGRVEHSERRGWCLHFRTVWWPGAQKARRVRVYTVPGYGRLESEEEAAKALESIRAEALHRPLHEVLSQYMRLGVSEDSVLHRWRHQFLGAKRLQHEQGQLSRTRLLELERYEGRGYLAWWEGAALAAVSAGQLEDWRAWLGSQFSHLAPKSIRNILTDFGTFLRYAKRRGALREVPELPTIRVPEYEPRIPGERDLRRILEAIPAEIRGLWLARALMGLRPSESRRLNVSDVRDGTLVLPGKKTKTGRGRRLQLHPALAEWIGAHRSEATPWEPLFVNPRALNAEHRWRASTERLVWVRALREAGIEHVRPNEGGRHAFATHALQGGADAYILKGWLGHTDIKTTERYARLSPSTIAKVLRPKVDT